MSNKPFERWSGTALVAAGFLTFVINSVLTPLLPQGAAFDVVAASPVFLWRQGASALAAGLLLFGCIGLYLRQAHLLGKLGLTAFVVTFLGSALLLATEWGEIFLVRDLALRVPGALRTLDSGRGPSLYDLGAIIPLVTFTLGWLAFAAFTFRARALSRSGAALVIIGFFAIPMLTPVLPRLWGAILGNAILAAGWILLGRDLCTTPDDEMP